jgi:hypothetical protein
MPSEKSGGFFFDKTEVFKMKKVLMALVMVLICLAGIARADTVQWQSTPEEKVSYQYKVGFYVRTTSESPLVIDLADPTVYDTHLDQFKFTGDYLKVKGDVTAYDTHLDQFKFTGDYLKVKGDVTAYDTQLEQLKFTGDDLKVTLDSESVAVTMDDRSVYDTQLEQFKFDGEYLKVKLSDTINVDTLNVAMDTVESLLTDLKNLAGVDSGYAVKPATGASFDVNLTDNQVYDTQLEQFKFTSDYLKVQLNDIAAYDTQLEQLKFTGDYLKVQLNDIAAYDTQLEQLKFTGDDLKVTLDSESVAVTMDDRSAYDTQLEQLKFTGDYLKVQLNDIAAYDTQLEQLKFDGDDLKVTLDSENVAVTGTVTPAAVTGTVFTSDGQVKAAAGTVYAVMVGGVGVTVGDKIELKNSADGSGTSLITVVADAANGNWTFCPSVGITYGTAVYMDETKASGGTFTVTVVWQ